MVGCSKICPGRRARPTRSGVVCFAHIGGLRFGLALIGLFADRPHEDYAGEDHMPVY
jgi:membrane associated rhomboid family serine protease